MIRLFILLHISSYFSNILLLSSAGTSKMLIFIIFFNISSCVNDNQGQRFYTICCHIYNISFFLSWYCMFQNFWFGFCDWKNSVAGTTFDMVFSYTVYLCTNKTTSMEVISNYYQKKVNTLTNREGIKNIIPTLPTYYNGGT